MGEAKRRREQGGQRLRPGETLLRRQSEDETIARMEALVDAGKVKGWVQVGLVEDEGQIRVELSTLGGMPMLEAWEALGVARDAMRKLMGVDEEPGDIEDLTISPEIARDAYGEQMSGFMREVAEAAKRHGILAVSVTSIALDGIRTVSTGTNDEARKVARMLALLVNERVAELLGPKVHKTGI